MLKPDPVMGVGVVKRGSQTIGFLKTYWERVSPKWKPSTLYTHRYYKRKYLDRAFEGLFLDEIGERHVQEWFNRIRDDPPRPATPGEATLCVLESGHPAPDHRHRQSVEQAA